MPSENRSMCRDLFREFMRWLGFLHQEEIKEGFLSHAEVKEGFLPREEVNEGFLSHADIKQDFVPRAEFKAAFVPRDIVARDFVPRDKLKGSYQPLPLQWWVARFSNGSSVTRVWDTKDVPLCDLCKDHPCAAKAFGDTGETSICVIRTDKILEDAEVRLFTRKASEKPPAK
jgi:hypothetical protein